jgi:hypothetical protein
MFRNPLQSTYIAFGLRAKLYALRMNLNVFFGLREKFHVVFGLSVKVHVVFCLKVTFQAFHDLRMKLQVHLVNGCYV